MGYSGRVYQELVLCASCEDEEHENCHGMVASCGGVQTYCGCPECSPDEEDVLNEEDDYDR